MTYLMLSIHQKQTLWDNDKPIQDAKVKLIARPGTGKTQTVSSYAIDLASNHVGLRAYQGIAMLSYTNVAKQEISKRIRQLNTGYELLDYPNYIGTFDSFINNFIFLPFGHRFMGAGTRPRLVGEPFGVWSGLLESAPSHRTHSMYFDCFSFSKDGTIKKLLSSKYVNGTARRLPTDNNKITNMKNEMFGRGFALQADANYIAFKLLEQHEDLRKLVAGRFPIIIVDEAQDLTETQHAILDLLLDGDDGLRSCVLVGDNAQAIYEWNTARPDLLTDKQGFQLEKLTETFRCSKSVCNLLNAITNDDYTISPAGKNLTYTDDIDISEIDFGDTDQIEAAYTSFLEYIQHKEPHDDKMLKIAILARPKSLIATIKSVVLGEEVIETPIFQEKSSKDFLRIIYYCQKNNWHKAWSAYERYWKNLKDKTEIDDLADSINHEVFNQDNYDAKTYRKNVIILLKKISEQAALFTKVSELSVLSADTDLKRYFPTIIKNTTDFAGFVARSGGDTSISDLFSNEQEKDPILVHFPNGKLGELHIGTVHSVKGETYDGVLYFSKDNTRHSRDRCDQSGNAWKKILTHGIELCEDKRIVYVALSRTAQTLWIAGESEVCEAFSDLIT